VQAAAAAEVAEPAAVQVDAGEQVTQESSQVGHQPGTEAETGHDAEAAKEAAEPSQSGQEADTAAAGPVEQVAPDNGATSQNEAGEGSQQPSATESTSAEPDAPVASIDGTDAAPETADAQANGASATEAERPKPGRGAPVTAALPAQQQPLEAQNGPQSPPPPPAKPQLKHSQSSLSSLNRGSAVFVKSALESLQSARDARRNKELKDTAQRALEMIKAAGVAQGAGRSDPRAGPVPTVEAVVDPRIIFEPLRLAIVTRSAVLMTTALDCVGKLISYSFFVDDADYQAAAASAPDWQNAADLETVSQTGQHVDVNSLPLLDLVTSTICDAFDESVDEKAQLQIIKALLALVIGTSSRIHQSSLLKAVRTVYNIFLLSKNSSNQAVASGSLSQIRNVGREHALHPRDQAVPLSQLEQECGLQRQRCLRGQLRDLLAGPEWDAHPTEERN